MLRKSLRITVAVAVFASTIVSLSAQALPILNHREKCYGLQACMKPPYKNCTYDTKNKQYYQIKKMRSCNRNGGHTMK